MTDTSPDTKKTSQAWHHGQWRTITCDKIFPDLNHAPHDSCPGNGPLARD